MQYKSILRVALVLCALNADSCSASFLSNMSHVLNKINISGMVQPAKQFVSRHVPATVCAAACVAAVSILAVPAVRRNIRQSTINASLAIAKCYCSSRWFKFAQWLGADINARDARNGTMLHKAVEHNNVQLFNVLLGVGARTDLDSLDSSGSTLLCRAVKSGNVAMAEALLIAGAQPNKKDGTGKAAIHYATELSNHEVIRVLARHKADLHSIGGSYSPLGIAIQDGDEETLKTLLDVGANPEMPCFLQENALGVAITGKKLNIIRLLHAHDKINFPGRFKRTMFATSSFRDTALHEATRSAYNHDGEEIVQFLLDHGGKRIINIKNQAGETPLHIAVNDERCNVALMLIQNGASIKITNNRKQTPIQACVDSELREQLVRAAAQ